MTVFVVRFDPDTGEIIDSWHEVNEDYTPDSNELVDPPDVGPPFDLRGKVVDTATGELVDDPEAEFKYPGVVDRKTRELIADRFRSKGSDALNELDAIEQNSNVPAEVTAYLQDQMAMMYLVYVSLTGDRIESVEGRFFG